MKFLDVIKFFLSVLIGFCLGIPILGLVLSTVIQLLFGRGGFDGANVNFYNEVLKIIKSLPFLIGIILVLILIGLEIYEKKHNNKGSEE